MNKPEGPSVRAPWVPWAIRRVVRKALRLPRSIADQVDVHVLGRFAPPGSRSWLVQRERHYGGYFRDSKLPHRSALDKRPGTHKPLRSPGNEGGDRMARSHHGYASDYAKIVGRINSQSPVIVELGVLRGTGLAIWSDLYPQATVVALDIDFEPFERYRATLLARGAFRRSSPICLPFDAYSPDLSSLEDALQGRPIDLFIDDGPHDPIAVEVTASAVRSLFKQSSIYVCEDALEALPRLVGVFPDYDVVVGKRGLIVAGRRVESVAP